MGKDSLLLQPIKVGNLTLKNRIMFPPQTTGYEERDGSIGERSFNFYKRVAEGGSGYVIIGDVAPVMTASPTPKLCDDRQIPTFKKLADMMHEYDCKVALQLFHPEYDVPGVGRMIVDAISNRDSTTATGAIIMTTILSGLILLVVDLLYAVVDPRIKAQYTKGGKKA